MTLTGKAKEDFEYWLLKERNEKIKHGKIEYDLYYLYQYILPEDLKYQLIIEWLDSVKIYIQSWNATEQGSPVVQYDCDIKYGNNLDSIDGFYLTRQEATTEAIKKANEIYNSINTTKL